MRKQQTGVKIRRKEGTWREWEQHRSGGFKKKRQSGCGKGVGGQRIEKALIKA